MPRLFAIPLAHATFALGAPYPRGGLASSQPACKIRRRAEATLNTLIILAHPNPKSFNAAIKETVTQEIQQAGGEVRLHDLYQARFDPILKADDFNELFQGRVPKDVQPLQQDLTWAQLIVTIFPTWWASTPAILKGYFDRVLTNGFAFRYSEKGVEGLLAGRKAIIFQTTGSPKEMLESANLPNAMKDALHAGTLEFCGIQIAAHQFFYELPTSTDEERAQMLDQVRQVMQQATAGASHV